MQLGLDLGQGPLPRITPAFDGPAGFAAALSRWQEGAAASGSATLFAQPLDTPLGTMVAVCDATHVHLLEFADRAQLPQELCKLAGVLGPVAVGETPITARLSEQITDYFSGQLTRFDLPLALHGSAFVQSVWRALIELPYGSTQSYGALAAVLGNPAATRAVARANGANQIAVIVPCHRVIGADGSLTGYAGGIWRKRALLDLEQRAFQSP